jgi:hypothetical protein
MIEWPPELIEELARRKCVLYIGSGVSANSRGNGGVRPPTWANFLKDALRATAGSKKHIEAHLRAGDLLSACDLVRRKLDDRWPIFLREKFVDPQFQPSAIHEHIFSLDARIVITPNFDNIYDRLASQKSQGTISVKTYSDPDVIDIVRSGGRFILKIHGDIDSVANLIFTKSQYAGARTRFPNVYKIVESLLVVNSFLFIGCGLNDPDISLLMEDYNFLHGHAAPHYIILPGPIHQDDIRLIRETRNLKIVTYDKRDDHRSLVDGIESLATLVETKRGELARDNNW